MNQYGKHYRQCYTGSMRGAGATVFAIWGFCIANAEAPGRVELMPDYLAQIIGCPEVDIVQAIEYLTSPDPRSRSSEEGGRRLIQIGRYMYQIVNWAYYSELNGDEDQRDYWRKSKAAQRERRKTEAEGKKGNGRPEPTETPPETKRHQAARPILHYLNEKAGMRYRETDTNLGLIGARLAEPEVTQEGVRLMIDRQVRMWKGTTMEQYLRPETLFNATKFDGYYAARSQPIPDSKTPSTAKPISQMTGQEMLRAAV